MKKGKFIVFEGLDGSGKTTLAKMLYEKMLNSCECILTYEPSDGLIGKLCRSIGTGDFKAEHETEAILYAADRQEHLAKEILPALNSGKTVICDRYYLSGLAYQSVNVDYKRILAYNETAMRILRADMTLFINVPPMICEIRRNQRNGTPAIYENIDYSSKVYENYLSVVENFKNTENIEIINGCDDLENVFKEVLEKCDLLFNETMKFVCN